MVSVNVRKTFYFLPGYHGNQFARMAKLYGGAYAAQSKLYKDVQQPGYIFINNKVLNCQYVLSSSRKHRKMASCPFSPALAHVITLQPPHEMGQLVRKGTFWHRDDILGPFHIMKAKVSGILKTGLKWAKPLIMLLQQPSKHTMFSSLKPLLTVKNAFRIVMLSLDPKKWGGG